LGRDPTIPNPVKVSREPIPPVEEKKKGKSGRRGGGEKKGIFGFSNQKEITGKKKSTR